MKYTLLFLLGLNGFTSIHAIRKPNILYIMSDDHAAHGISAYGGRLAKIAPTPNLDRLAKEGALFNNAFCTNSICSPSRACVLTGQYNHTNGTLRLNPETLITIAYFPDKESTMAPRFEFVGRNLGARI
jgi:N-acetylglucosamine-6-sulfatase